MNATSLHGRLSCRLHLIDRSWRALSKKKSQRIRFFTKSIQLRAQEIVLFFQIMRAHSHLFLSDFPCVSRSLRGLVISVSSLIVTVIFLVHRDISLVTPPFAVPFDRRRSCMRLEKEIIRVFLQYPFKVDFSSYMFCHNLSIHSEHY